MSGNSAVEGGTNMTEKKLQKCSFCSQQCCQDSMKRHLIQSHGQMLFSCCICSAEDSTSSKFESFSDIRQHLNSFHSIEPSEEVAEEIVDQLIGIPGKEFLIYLVCKLCAAKLVASSETELTSHLKSVHNIPNNPVLLQRFVKRGCRLCGNENFKSEVELSSHIDKEHERSRFWNDDSEQSANGNFDHGVKIEPPEMQESVVATECDPTLSFKTVSQNDISHTKTATVEKVGSIISEEKSSLETSNPESTVKEIKPVEANLEKIDVKNKVSEKDTATPAIKEPKGKNLRKRDLSSGSEALDEIEKILATELKKKVVAKKIRHSSESDESSSMESTSSEEDKEKSKKRKRKSKKSKKKKKKRKRDRSSSSSSSAEEGETSDSGSADSDKDAIEIFTKKKAQLKSSESLDSSKGEKNGLISEKNRYKSPVSDDGDAFNTKTSRRSKSRGSHRSKDRGRSSSRSVSSRRSHSGDRSSRRSSDSEDRRRSRHRSRRSFSDNSDDHHARRKSDQDGVGGFCDDCNVPIPAGGRKEHFGSQMHMKSTYGKRRCFLCNLSINDTKMHLEKEHQDDIFRCNVRNCPNPKFVDARKILDHLERSHARITQGKTVEQLAKGGFFKMPKNLEVHSCGRCNLSFASQPISTVFMHMQDRCGVRNPRPSEVVFSCRLCGPRRVFDTISLLQKHCKMHYESVRESRYTSNFNIVRKRSETPPVRRNSRRSQSNSKSPDSFLDDNRKSLFEPRFNCFFCDFTSESETNRNHHIQVDHTNSLFTCKICSSEPFRTAHIFDLYFHLNEDHKKSEKESELNRFIQFPDDLRKIICLECDDLANMQNSQWLCREPFEVANDLKDHLLTSHKNVRVVSRSFGLRCSGCNAQFDYENEEEWLRHVKSAHKKIEFGRTVILKEVESSVGRCPFCPKSQHEGHVLSEHKRDAFLCKLCYEGRGKWFPDFQRARRHILHDHAGDSGSSNVMECIEIPTNLICLVCKFCSAEFHGQTMEALEKHFKVDHPTLKNISSHTDYICRICMTTDVHETYEDLCLHIRDLHRSLLDQEKLNDSVSPQFDRRLKISMRPLKSKPFIVRSKWD